MKIMMNFFVRILAAILVSTLPAEHHATAASFPRGKCYDRACASSPYDFTWVSQRKLDQNTSELCFDITARPDNCTESKYKCCSTFKKELFKFVIDTKTKCKKAIRSVRIDGREKKGGVYFDTYEKNRAELRLTNLAGISAEDMATNRSSDRVQFCMTVAPPCRNIKSLCMRKNKACKVSVWETKRHECCATCKMNSTING